MQLREPFIKRTGPNHQRRRVQVRELEGGGKLSLASSGFRSCCPLIFFSAPRTGKIPARTPDRRGWSLVFGVRPTLHSGTMERCLPSTLRRLLPLATRSLRQHIIRHQ